MTQTDSHLTILDRLVAVNLSITIWSARKKLTAADFGGVNLPPEELASLGSKKICDPERLRIFGTLKARAVSKLDSLGIRFLGGWAIPENQASAVHDFLLKLRDEFLSAKDVFLNSYDQAIQDWVDKHPGWERLIADSPVSVDQVRNRLGFKWQLYKVAGPDPNDAASVNLVNEIEALGQTLFGEVSNEARVIWQKVYAGKTEVSHKALSPLKNLHRKLTGLSFVEPRVAPVADLIEAALNSMPRRGLINGPHLVLLQGLVALLRDPCLLLEHGQKVIDGHSPGQLLQNLGGILQTRNDSQSEEEAELPVLPAAAGPQFVDSLGLW
jgi:hypothetical protein